MLICGTEQCPCVRKKCERYGKCEECIEHHKTHKKYSLPYCQRKAAKSEDKTTRAADQASRAFRRMTHKAKKSDNHQDE